MKAIIFDMDGTLVASEKVHRKAFFKGLDELKVDYDYKEVLDFLIENQGIPDYVFTEKFIEKNKLDIKLEDIIRLKRYFYSKLISSEVEAYPGAVDFVKSFKGKYKLAIATSSNQEDMEGVLKKIGLFDIFDQRVSGAELENPKPAPDIFLITAEKLGVDIKDCLIFEDSIHGLMAAKKSGAKVIAYDNKENDNDYMKDYYVIDDYRKVSPKDLETILKKLEEKWKL